ncbi:MAG: hypothetical protein KC620_07675 [Myxococcales bacterium]|nr:hypothetical protein [Myxococcales bacterium]
MQTRLLALIALALAATFAPSDAQAQSTPVSELWREWAALEREWRDEQVEAAAVRARLEAARAARKRPKPAEKQR